MKKIFLISQPRSGSSLLQHMIGAHSCVHTFPESWLLLPIFYALRESGHQADYQAVFAAKNIHNFIEHLPNKSADYKEAINAHIDNLFTKAASGSGCEYVMDKTPRYYHIINDMIEWLTDSKFILLRRNPLAVMASIINTNFNGDWSQLAQQDRYHDLITAPNEINAAKKTHKKDITSVKYEDLVDSPEEEIEKIFEYLELPYEESVIEYGGKVKFKGSMGKDRKSLYRHAKPVSDYKDAWLSTYHNPQINYLARQYLDILGPQLLSEMGYSHDDLTAMLPAADKKPFGLGLVSWQTLMKAPLQRSIGEKISMKFARRSIQNG